MLDAFLSFSQLMINYLMLSVCAMHAFVKKIDGFLLRLLLTSLISLELDY